MPAPFVVLFTGVPHYNVTTVFFLMPIVPFSARFVLPSVYRVTSS